MYNTTRIEPTYKGFLKALEYLSGVWRKKKRMKEGRKGGEVKRRSKLEKKDEIACNMYTITEVGHETFYVYRSYSIFSSYFFVYKNFVKCKNEKRLRVILYESFIILVIRKISHSTRNFNGKPS